MSNYLDNLRILIVEDDKPTADLIQRDLKQDFSGVRVDWACTVAEGREFLAAARKAGFAYDVAILDYMLPLQSASQATAPDSFVHTEILKGSPETIVIQVSAYDDDPDIRRLQETRVDGVEDYATFVPKTGDWIPRLIAEFVRAIHSRRIRRRFEALSLSAESPSSEWQSRGVFPTRSGSGRSLAVAEFCVDAAQHWQFLCPDFQDQLKSTFGFAEIDGVPYLGVAEEDIEESDEESTETRN